MASNRELAARARELGRARGVEVDTRGLDNAGLTALVEQLEAEQPREISAEPGEPAAAAEPKEQQPDADPGGPLPPTAPEPKQHQPDPDAGAPLPPTHADAPPESPELAKPTTASDDDVEPETWRPRARALRRGLFVAPDKAVLCSRGVHLHAGDEVQQGDFDLPTIRLLLAKGTIIDGSP